MKKKKEKRIKRQRVYNSKKKKRKEDEKGGIDVYSAQSGAHLNTYSQYRSSENTLVQLPRLACVMRKQQFLQRGKRIKKKKNDAMQPTLGKSTARISSAHSLFRLRSSFAQPFTTARTHALFLSLSLSRPP